MEWSPIGNLGIGLFLSQIESFFGCILHWNALEFLDWNSRSTPSVDPDHTPSVELIKMAAAEIKMADEK